MIKAVGTKDGEPMFIFGLSNGNLDRLRQGRPIPIDLKQLGGKGSMLLMWGETEEDMVDALRAAGLTLPEPKPDTEPPP